MRKASIQCEKAGLELRLRSRLFGMHWRARAADSTSRRKLISHTFLAPMASCCIKAMVSWLEAVAVGADSADDQRFDFNLLG